MFIIKQFYEFKFHVSRRPVVSGVLYLILDIYQHFGDIVSIVRLN